MTTCVFTYLLRSTLLHPFPFPSNHPLSIRNAFSRFFLRDSSSFLRLCSTCNYVGSIVSREWYIRGREILSSRNERLDFSRFSFTNVSVTRERGSSRRNSLRSFRFRPSSLLSLPSLPPSFRDISRYLDRNFTLPRETKEIRLKNRSNRGRISSRIVRAGEGRKIVI